MTKELTNSSSRFIHDKIIVSRPVNKFPVFCGTRKFITVFSTTLNCTLSHKKSIQDGVGYHQCGFRRSRSINDQIFCTRQILEKMWEHNGTERQLFVDFEKAYDLVSKAVLCNILMESGMPMELLG